MSKIKTYWIVIALGLLSAMIWQANYSLHFNGFFWNDSHDYNQMARNILYVERNQQVTNDY